MIRLSLVFIIAIFVNVCSAQIFIYDELNRLVKAAYPDGAEISYRYDLLGNRIKLTSSASALAVNAKVYLEGPFDVASSLHSDSLRTRAYLPTTEPFTTMGYTGVANAGVVVENSTLRFGVSGSNAISDWILIELRSAQDTTAVITRQAALLQRDGAVVDVSGTGGVQMRGVPPGMYHVVIRHRNHLSIRTKNPVNVGTDGQVVDFTTGVNVFGLNPMAQVGSFFALYSGDANRDGEVNAVDKNVEWRTQNGQVYDYFNSPADFNMDTEVNAVDKNTLWRVNNGKGSQGGIN